MRSSRRSNFATGSRFRRLQAWEQPRDKTATPIADLQIRSLHLIAQLFGTTADAAPQVPGVLRNPKGLRAAPHQDGLPRDPYTKRGVCCTKSWSIADGRLRSFRGPED